MGGSGFGGIGWVWRGFTKIGYAWFYTVSAVRNPDSLLSFTWFLNVLECRCLMLDVYIRRAYPNIRKGEIMQKRRSPTPVILSLLISCMCIAYGQQAAGLYASVDFRSDPDSGAKVAEFKTASQNGGAYYFRLLSGRQIKVDAEKYRGAVYYPSLKGGVSVDHQKKKLTELRAFSKRFPASARYLTTRIGHLSRRIHQMEKSAEAQSSDKNKDDSSGETLVLKNGKTYRGMILREKLPDGIKIIHKGGAATIPFEALPDALIAKLGGFDPDEVKEYRKTDEERWQEEEAKLRREMARRDGLLAKEEAAQRRLLERRLRNLVKPLNPGHGQIDRIIRGRILNVFDDGILISVGRAGVCKVEMNSSAFVDDEIVSDIVERTDRRYRYTAVSGALKTVPVYVPVSNKVREHFKRKDKYLASKRTIESEIDEIESAPVDRVRENERLLKKKEIEFKRNRALYSKDS
jgi:prefoldin subunit 5